MGIESDRDVVMRMIWTPKDDVILKKLYPRVDIPPEEIMKVFPGRSWSSIQNRATRVGNLHRKNCCKIDQGELVRLTKVYKI